MPHAILSESGVCADRAPALSAEEPPASDPAPTPHADPRSELRPGPALAPGELFPAITLDRAAGHVDVRGRVIGGPVEWLELLACRPGTREHESVVTLDARAEHLHAALLLLGLTPGAPADARWEGDELVQTPPRGPELKVFFVFDDAPDRPVPAGAYVADQATGALLDPAGPDQVARAGGSRRAGGRGRLAFHRLPAGRGPRPHLLPGRRKRHPDLAGELRRRSDRPRHGAPADGGNGFWTLDPAPAGWPPLPAPETPLTVRLVAVADPAQPPVRSPARPSGGPDNPPDPAPQR